MKTWLILFLMIVISTGTITACTQKDQIKEVNFAYKAVNHISLEKNQLYFTAGNDIMNGSVDKMIKVDMDTDMEESVCRIE